MKLIGNHPALLRAQHAAQLAAFVDAPVMLCAETGSGRNLLGSVIHASGAHRDKALHTFNCGTPETHELLSQNIQAVISAFQPDGGGTLILRQVELLAPDAQRGLLELIGGDSLTRENIRLVTTCANDLADQVARGDFLETLHLGLNVIAIDIPSLRERCADVPLLAKHFLGYFSSRYKRAVPRFAASAMRAMQRYSWPGNVGELRNLCERMAILLPGKDIEADNLPSTIRQPRPAPAIPGFVLPPEGLSLELLEQDLMRQALEKAEGNRSRAARLLGISRDTLNYRLKKFAVGQPGS